MGEGILFVGSMNTKFCTVVVDTVVSQMSMFSA